MTPTDAERQDLPAGLTLRQREVLTFVQDYVVFARQMPTLGVIARRFHISRQRASVYLQKAKPDRWFTR